MNFNKILLLLVCSAFFLSVGAQTDYSWKQGTSNGYTYKYVNNDPINARFYTLKNGLTVILSENKKEPRIAVNIAVRAGSNTDPKDHTGLAHYLEHILFKGTDKFGTLNWKKEQPYIDSITNAYERYTRLTDPEERKSAYAEIDRLSGEASKYSIANEYDKLMSNLGSQGTNAHTWFEETVYKEDIPSNSMDKFLIVQAERFRKPVIRIFHTELEAVYEEKNRSLDNDGGKAWEVMLYHLFPTHNYGQQSTIGTIEHLKNPSIKAIQAYYDKYYVPNNMAIIMSGDFKSDDVIKKIDQHFSYMKSKPLELYNPAAEKPLTKIVEKDVFGPSAENFMLGYRTPASGTEDALILNIVSQLLNNGSAGLFDINLNKNQKVLRAGVSFQQLKDYGMFVLYGSPKEGQTLEELRPLLLNELNKIKSGDFDFALVKSIIANYKLGELRSTDNNSARLDALLTSYIHSKGTNWKKEVAALDDLSKVSKERIVQVANKYFGDNYVVINKRQGVDENTVKVEKPAITPVETNAGKASSFVQKVSAMPVDNISPQWLDYQKDIIRGKAGIADVLYVLNKDNQLFNLYYQFDIGTWSNPTLRNAVEYLQFLGTEKLSAEEISKAFYDIACSYSINVGAENTTIVISGLQENFEKAVSLFEEIIRNVKADEEALAALKGRWLKGRENTKLNKSAIASALRSYAQFGPKNPYNTVISNDELNSLRAADLIGQLHQLMNYEHKIIYYGPKSMDEFKQSIVRKHVLPASFTPAPEKISFTYTKQDKNKVLFADYDMVQSEVYWVRNLKPFDPSQEAVVSIFNNYFGGGMGSIVFQTIRESKALAYSTMARYVSPSRKEDPFTAIAYVGSQADKMNEAIGAMNELLNTLPVSERAYDLAVDAFKKDIETDRIVKDGIIFNYLSGLKKGYTGDVRKEMYKKAQSITFADIEKMHREDLANKAYTYCVVASKDRVKMADLEKNGEVQNISLTELFGY
ncbi:MAG: insulinase family protein [Ginsengibacter sp.]